MKKIRRFMILSGLALLILGTRSYGAGLEPSLKDFLKIGLKPVGRTMYVWGGGWNEEDNAAGIEAKTMGPSENWEAYFLGQDASYNYRKTRYRIHDGLDCSGYVGWALYNLLPNEEGYIMKARDMARTFADMGLGEFREKGSFEDFLPGDILSSKSHVYICLATSSDGSILLLHASPPGVMISGTRLAGGSSQSLRLAEEYMAAYYPNWHRKFPNYGRDASYIRDYDRFRWHEEALADPDGYRTMTAREILEDLFNEGKKELSLELRGQPVDLESKLIIRESRTYFPFRELVERIGGQVAWIEEEQKVIASYGPRTIEFTINSSSYRLDAREEKMDAQAFIDDGRTYIPLRYLYEGLGFSVDWLEDENKIIVEEKAL